MDKKPRDRLLRYLREGLMYWCHGNDMSKKDLFMIHLPRTFSKNSFEREKMFPQKGKGEKLSIPRRKNTGVDLIVWLQFPTLWLCQEMLQSSSQSWIIPPDHVLNGNNLKHRVFLVRILIAWLNGRVQYTNKSLQLQMTLSLPRMCSIILRKKLWYAKLR